MTTSLKIHASFEEIDCDQWNALIKDDNPFMRHEYFLALEQSGCTSPQTGWQIAACVAYENQTIKAAIPCYIKSHSYGEFIFDWSWANAYQRYGIDYYPKLVCMSPFTPVPAQRILSDDPKASLAIIEHLKHICTINHFSSLHCLFIEPEDADLLSQAQLTKRYDTQFHWLNNDYHCFDDYLQQMSAKYRKNTRQERRSIAKQNITTQIKQGAQLNDHDWAIFYQCYLNTIEEHGSQAYLNKPFFDQIRTTMAAQLFMAQAYLGDELVACALYFKSDDCVFGRYWGSLVMIKNLHFELCYYLPIDYCIEHQITRFEAGAQGLHKITRGLLPKYIYSAHWLVDPAFQNAIEKFIAEEKQHVEMQRDSLNERSPFKGEITRQLQQDPLKQTS